MDGRMDMDKWKDKVLYMYRFLSSLFIQVACSTNWTTSTTLCEPINQWQHERSETNLTLHTGCWCSISLSAVTLVCNRNSWEAGVINLILTMGEVNSKNVLILFWKYFCGINEIFAELPFLTWYVICWTSLHSSLLQPTFISDKNLGRSWI